MVEEKKGNVDVKYFKDFVQEDKITEYVSRLSGMGGHFVKVPILKGRILNFLLIILK